MAPILFIPFFTHVLMHTFRDPDKSNEYGLLFHLSHPMLRQKHMERLVTEALFTEYCALMVHKKADHQFIGDKFVAAPQLFGLIIRFGKFNTTNTTSYTIAINTSGVKIVEFFKYIRSIDHFILRLLCISISIPTRVLNYRKVKLPTKINVYNATVLWSILHSCETWTYKNTSIS